MRLRQKKTLLLIAFDWSASMHVTAHTRARPALALPLAVALLRACTCISVTHAIALLGWGVVGLIGNACIFRDERGRAAGLWMHWRRWTHYAVGCDGTESTPHPSSFKLPCCCIRYRAPQARKRSDHKIFGFTCDSLIELLSTKRRSLFPDIDQSVHVFLQGKGKKAEVQVGGASQIIIGTTDGQVRVCVCACVFVCTAVFLMCAMLH